VDDRWQLATSQLAGSGDITDGSISALKQLLMRLAGTARSHMPVAGKNDPLFDFGSRLECSGTLSQLALRCAEFCVGSLTWREGFTNLCDDLAAGVGAGTKLEVHVERDGQLCWIDAIVVAVWPDGAFRVQVGSDNEWVEDFPPPASREGRKLLGSEWRPSRAVAQPAVSQPEAAPLPEPPQVPMQHRETRRKRTAPEDPRVERASRSRTHEADAAAVGRAAEHMNGAASAVPPNARLLGHSLVGSRLSVWWEEDEAWYAGTVRAFSDALGEHLVCYDDGEQRQELLDECSWKRGPPQAKTTAPQIRRAPEPQEASTSTATRLCGKGGCTIPIPGGKAHAGLCRVTVLGSTGKRSSRQL